MPQTGEMGVRYTLCAELRKTTTVGPLFVNQTQGQNKMLSGAPWVLVIIIENCQTKEHFYWFMYLLIYLFLSSSHFPWSLLGFAAEPVLQSHCLLLNSTLHKSCLVQKSLQGLHMESRTIKSVMCVSGTEMGGGGVEMDLKTHFFKNLMRRNRNEQQIMNKCGSDVFLIGIMSNSATVLDLTKSTFQPFIPG